MEKKNRILIRKVSLPNEDRIYELHDLIYKFQKTYHDSDNKDGIDTMCSEVNTTIKLLREAYWKRRDEFKQLLYGFWKVIQITKDGTEQTVMYLYPHRFNDNNRMLFALCSYDYGYNRCKNGVCEESFDIMDEPLLRNNDLVFEESSEDEMMENAKKSCVKALDYRMWTLKYRDNVLD